MRGSFRVRFWRGLLEIKEMLGFVLHFLWFGIGLGWMELGCGAVAWFQRDGGRRLGFGGFVGFTNLENFVENK